MFARICRGNLTTDFIIAICCKLEDLAELAACAGLHLIYSQRTHTPETPSPPPLSVDRVAERDETA